MTIEDIGISEFEDIGPVQRVRNALERPSAGERVLFFLFSFYCSVVLDDLQLHYDNTDMLRWSCGKKVSVCVLKFGFSSSLSDDFRCHIHSPSSRSSSYILCGVSFSVHFCSVWPPFVCLPVFWETVGGGGSLTAAQVWIHIQRRLRFPKAWREQ